MRAATAPIACRCRRASSISAARRRRRTSAPRRCCSPSWPRCMRSSTARRAQGDRPAASTARPCGWPRAWRSLGFTVEPETFFDTITVEVGTLQGVILRAAVAEGVNLRKVGDDQDRHHARRAHAAGDARGGLARLRRRLARLDDFEPRLPPARGPAPDQRLPDPSDLPHEPRRERDDALHAPARRPRPGARPRDDPARLLHDEAQRHGRDAADHLAGILPTSIPSCRPTRRWATRR